MFKQFRNRLHKLRSAVEYAEKAALCPGSKGYMELSAKMCWTAVLYCAVEGGVISKRDAEMLAITKTFITPSDFQIKLNADLQHLEAGYLLGYFCQGTLIHSMLSMGSGKAAGNKNDCIGVGAPLGWEILDLSVLKWNADGSFSAVSSVTASGMPKLRNIELYYRSLADLK